MKVNFDRRKVLAALALSPLLPKTALANIGLRVACLDWALAETVLALGIKPIAIVAASDWSRFVVEPPLPPGVADLGLQQEINLELLASLEPDLILTSPFIPELNAAFGKIAQTVRLSIFEKTARPLEQPRILAEALGQRLDRVEAAQRFLGSAEQSLDAYRARIAALNSPPVLLVSFIDSRHVRVYGGSGLFQNVLDRIGVANAWTGDANYWGFATVGIEKLATAKDFRLIAFAPIPPDAQPTLQHSPLWTKLPCIEAGHVSILPPVLMFGAMPSALRFARLLVQHLENLPA